MAITEQFKKLFTRQKNSTDSLVLLLKRRVRENQKADQASLVAPYDLFLEFVKSDMAYLGALSSGYGECGKEVHASPSINFGELVAPAGIDLKVGGKIGGASGSQALIVLHVHPKSMAGFSAAAPICLMKLDGKRRTATASISGKAGIGLPESVTSVASAAGIETLALSLEAKGEASLSGEYMSLIDEAPRWFSGPLDSDLKKFFSLALGSGSKGDLKQEVADWLVQKCGVPLEGASTREGSWQGWVGPKLTQHFDLLKFDPKNPKKGAKNWRTENLLEILNYLQDYYADEQAVKKLEEKKISVPPLKERVLILTYINLLDQPAREPEALKDSPYNSLCFVSLWGHTRDGSTSIQAEARLGKKVDAGAEAQATGYLKHTAYRFQTWTPAKNFKGNMIMTQDTVIDYRMVQKSAEAHLKKPEKEKPLVYNMMTYRSAVVFWRYPEKTEDINTVFRASETNSGVCFGVSVQALKLRECVLAASALSSEQEILLDSLSAQLRMTTDQLKTCLSESWVFDREFKPDFPTEIILLESSFTTEPSLTADIVAPQKNQSPYQIKNGFLDEMVARTRTLQAVRIRYRIADLAENKQTLFKLGDSDSSPGIQLNSVTRAGSEGVVDIDTQWMTPYLKDQLSESPDPSKASRQAIPPVALLHQ
ncbi:MAG: hypothetical protein KBE23_13855 [Chloroflexi bacterium]|nr:hypothetical protein [Chloroflexota bacterium]MBP7043825.1 hypothetical protein [Chloroflexota bacterium]